MSRGCLVQLTVPGMSLFCGVGFKSNPNVTDYSYTISATAAPWRLSWQPSCYCSLQGSLLGKTVDYFSYPVANIEPFIPQKLVSRDESFRLVSAFFSCVLWPMCLVSSGLKSCGQVWKGIPEKWKWLQQGWGVIMLLHWWSIQNGSPMHGIPGNPSQPSNKLKWRLHWDFILSRVDDLDKNKVNE